MQQIYKVYLLRNKKRDIIYCGITRQTLQKRYDEHIRLRNLNRSETTIELVVDELNVIQAAELEKKLIEQYNLLKTGLNKSPGSINGFSNYHSEEQKAKWRQERKGVPVSKEHAEKNRRARIGLKNSEYHKRMVSEKKSKKVMCIENGKIYPSARAAAKELNISYVRISDICRGVRKSTKGYSFKFA